MRGSSTEYAQVKRVCRDTRSVSEIYGTALVLSLAVVTAMLMVGVGSVVIGQMEGEAEDSLSQDAMIEMNDRMADISGSSVDATTSFEFPSGSDVTAQPEIGTANITIETIDDFWDEDESERYVGANEQVNFSKVTMGTIVHEAEDGTITAAQGGGVWERQDDHVSMVEPPAIDYRGGTLDLSFTALGDIEPVLAGNRVTATHNVSASEAAGGILEEYLRYQQTVPGSSLTAGVYVNVTIESEFAEGWKQYAAESMQDRPSAIYGPDNPTHDLGPDEVKLVFGPFGDHLGFDQPDWGGPVCYSGLSEYAPMYNNDDRCDVDTRADGGYYLTMSSGAGPGSASGSSPGETDHQVGLYYENQWVMYDPDDGYWQTFAGGNEIDKPEAVIDLGESGNPADPEYYYHFEPNTPICIVQGTSLGGQLTGGSANCLEEMVGIDDDDIPEPEFSEYVVESVETDREVVAIGEEIEVTATVTNDGPDAEPGTPVALFFDGTLVAGEEEITLNEGQTQEYEFVLEPSETGEGHFIGATKDDYAESEAVEVLTPSEASNFVVPDIEVSETDVAPGETITVEAEIDNIGEAGDEQYVRLHFEDGGETLLDYTEVELDAHGGEDDTQRVEFDWTPDESHKTADGSLIVRTDDADNEVEGIRIAGDEQSGVFLVHITDTDDPTTEGEELTATAWIDNDEDADTQTITLRNFDGHPVDVKEVSLDDDEDTEVDLTWHVGYDVVEDGEVVVQDEISVTSNDDSADTMVTIEEADQEERDPFDVYLAMDETGSLAFNYSHQDYLEWEWAHPGEVVPEGETWKVHPDWAEPGNEWSTYLYAGDVVTETKQLHRGMEGQDPFGKRIDAARSLIDELDPDGDRVGAYQWTEPANQPQGVNHLENLTSDFDTVKESLFADPGGGTDITNAIAYATVLFDEQGHPDHERALVLFTDGMHTSETYDPPLEQEFGGQTIVEIAAEMNITIHTVGLGPLVEDEELSEIAAQTGGIYVPVENPDDLEDAFGDIVDEIESSQPTFEVTDFDVPEAVDPGETVTVEADFENTGSDGGFQDVILEVDNAIVDVRSVYIPEGGTATDIEFKWDTANAVPPTSRLTLSTQDDAAIRTVDVNEDDRESHFEVSIDEDAVPDEVDQDQHLHVPVQVNNTGEIGDAQFIWLEVHVGGEWIRVDVLDNPVSLDAPGGNNETTVGLGWDDMSGVDPGDYRVRAGSDDDFATPVEVDVVGVETAVSTEIESVRDDDFEEVEEGASIADGEELSIVVEYTNEESEPVTDYTVELRVDSPGGDMIGLAEIEELDPGESTWKTYSWDTGGYGLVASDRAIVSVTDSHTDQFELHVDPPEYQNGTPFGEDDSINIDLSEIEVGS